MIGDCGFLVNFLSSFPVWVEANNFHRRFFSLRGEEEQKEQQGVELAIKLEWESCRGERKRNSTSWLVGYFGQTGEYLVTGRGCE